MSVRFRLLPSPAQEVALLAHCAHARFVWNLALEQANMWRRWQGPTPNSAVRMRQLAEARQDNDWLASGSSSVQQGALRDFDTAMSGFFNGHKRRPRWRKAGVDEGFVVRDLKVKRASRRTGMVFVPKVGCVRFRLSRDWSALESATSARVTKKSGQWHVSFTTGKPSEITAGTGATVGIDRGVAASIATSDGVLDSAPGFSPVEEDRLVRLQRRLARQVKGSNRRAKTKASIGRLHLRRSNRRKDWVEKTTTDLARTYNLIALEDLKTSQMMRRPKPKPDPDTPGAFLPNGAAAKAGLNRGIAGSLWGLFEQRLSDKVGDRRLIKVPAAHTSQTCPECGHIARENRESQAVFACITCGHVDNADTNAARNILRRALGDQERGSVTNASAFGAEARALESTPTRGLSGARTHQPRTRRVNQPERALA